MADVRKTYCALCHYHCGLLLHVEDGRAVRVEGDPKHPGSRGGLCARGHLMIDHLYHPDRLNYPLKRVGERGENRWQRITWEQGLDEVAERLDGLRQRYGPETLAFTHGTDRTYHWDQRRFYNLFGSPNCTGVNTICMCPTGTIEYATFGGQVLSSMWRSKCIVLIGRAPSKSSPTMQFPGIVAAKKKGVRLIVVDPKRTRSAEMADLWLQIRPGSDLALMLGWLRLIIEEELYDKAFVEQWTVGFEELREAVAEYTPERVAEITWLTPQEIVESARMYATTKPGVIPWGVKLEQQGTNAVQAVRARCLLIAITGNLDLEGGEYLGWAEPIGDVIDQQQLELNDTLPPEQRAKQLGADQYPLFGFPGWDRIAQANERLPEGHMPMLQAHWSASAHSRDVFEAILTGEPYPVRAMISVASNPVLSFPNSRRTCEAIKALDLYVVSDYYLTPSALLADYVFPAASTIERSNLFQHHFYCAACPKGIGPLYERRDDYQFWRGLGVRLGQAEHWPWETVEEVWDYRLAPVGLTFEQLLAQNGLKGRREERRYEKYGFGTPSGKVELRSSIFEEMGCEPLPVYREPHHSPSNEAVARDYPLILVTGSRFMPMYHSEWRQIESARERWPEPQMVIHPQTAAERGIAEGDWVRVTTPQGSIRQQAHLTEAIHPRVVDVQHGWWFPEREAAEPELYGAFDSNANVLCPDEPEFCSPEIGSWPHTALMCRVEKEA